MALSPARQRVYFGMAGLSMLLPDMLIMQWLVVRYLPPDGNHLIPPAVLGAVLLLGRMSEGIACPLVGHFSDSCRHRWGRRLPFMRYLITPYLLVFFLLYHPPSSGMHWSNIVYVFILAEIYFVLYTSVFTPYLALIPELSRDSQERVNLTTSQAVFMFVGTLVFASMGWVLEQGGWLGLTATACAFILLFFLPAATRLRETPCQDTEAVALWPAIRMTLKNRPFRYVVASTSLFFFAVNGILLLMPYWVVSYLGGTEGDVPLMMAPYLLMNLIFFFVFNALAPILGKHKLMLATFLGTAIAMAGVAAVGLLPFGSPQVQTMLCMGFVGMPVAGFMVLPYAVLSDVIDYGARKTGSHGEAVFFGVQGVAQKAMMGLSVLTFTLVPYLGTPGTIYRPDRGAVFLGEYHAQDETHERPAALAPQPGVLRVQPWPENVAAPWALIEKAGVTREGLGAQSLDNMPPGEYHVVWGEIEGWQPPTARPPTPFGLKLTALLCALSCFAAFLVFLGYPIRERNGKAIVLGEPQEEGPG